MTFTFMAILPYFNSFTKVNDRNYKTKFTITNVIFTNVNHNYNSLSLHPVTIVNRYLIYLNRLFNTVRYIIEYQYYKRFIQ
jgi:hypothetical protein